MAKETRLSLRPEQRVVMTPLAAAGHPAAQLSTLELQEVVQKELLENPRLEEMQPETAEQARRRTPRPSADGGSPRSRSAATRADADHGAPDRDLPFELTAVIFDDHEERSLVAQEDREDLPFENMVRSVSR